MRLSLLGLLLLSTLCAQNAVVVQVADKDAEQLRLKHAAYLKAKAAFEEAEELVKDKYFTREVPSIIAVSGTDLVVSDNDLVSESGNLFRSNGNGTITRVQAPDTKRPARTVRVLWEEFSCGVEFDKDFRFGVPKKCPEASRSPFGQVFAVAN